MITQSGVLVVLTGPSGVGKGTLRTRICGELPDLQESISVTTRAKRETEEEGKDYFFVTRPQFEQMIQEKKLLEWAEFAGNLYGTPKKFVEEVLQKGKSILLEIDVNGALNIKNLFSKANLIFIEPPSWQVLEARLRGRNSNSEADIQNRLETAKRELEQKHQFDFCLVNDDLETTAKQLRTLIENLISKAQKV